MAGRHGSSSHASGRPADNTPTPNAPKPLRALLVILAIAVVAVSSVVAYQTATTVTSAERREQIDTADTKPAGSTPNNDRDRDLQTAMDQVAQDVARDFQAQVGIAVLGQRGPLHAGQLDNRAAWSTLKVPIAAAATQKAQSEGGPDAEAALQPAIAVAIENSDNDAALELWYALGDGSDELAAERLSNYLAGSGDTTDVPTEFQEGIFEGFGDTLWRASAQVSFLSRFACAPGSAPVLDAMSRITPEHRVGLGGVPGARFKGGWGLGYDERYLYRQMGFLPVSPDGRSVPIAVIVLPEDNSQETATAALDAITQALLPALPQATAADCPPPAQ